MGGYPYGAILSTLSVEARHGQKNTAPFGAVSYSNNRVNQKRCWYFMYTVRPKSKPP